MLGLMLFHISEKALDVAYITFSFVDQQTLQVVFAFWNLNLIPTYVCS